MAVHQTFKDVKVSASNYQYFIKCNETNHGFCCYLLVRGVGKTTCQFLARKINQPGYDDRTKILLLIF
jgi:hypothetical protein